MNKPLRKTVLITTLVTLSMFAFTFASAPLYNAICKRTNFNMAVRIIGAAPVLNRDVSIQFIATNNENLPWLFYPLTTTVHVHPNENTEIKFYAKNLSNKTMTVQAIPSYAPAIAVKYFHKIQCFCFNKQTLKAGEGLMMPVIFRVDAQLPSEIQTITLAYTLFDLNASQQRKSL